jgi:diguanylate cyclase (GGDEF)-like protein
VPFDTLTVFFVSTIISVVFCTSLLFFSLIKRENRPFIWASVASGSFAGALLLVAYGSNASNSYAIILGNTLAVFGLLAFYNLFCSIFVIAKRNWIITIPVLFFQVVLFVWFTLFHPSFTARVVVTNIIFAVISSLLLHLLWKNSSKGQHIFHFFASIPIFFLLCHSLFRLITVILAGRIEVSTTLSPAYALFILFYCIVSIWITLSSVFIVSNQLHSKLLNASMTDPLTGAMNRRALEEAVGREIAKTHRNGSPLSLIIIDLDHFKKVNDKYGHHAGDAILVHAVSKFRNIVRESDLVARLGGEEFVIVLPNSGLDVASHIAERLRSSFKKNVLRFEGQSIPVTSSFGVAGHNGKGIDFEELLRQADEALYRAKEQGRDRVVLFEPN